MKRQTLKRVGLSFVFLAISGLVGWLLWTQADWFREYAGQSRGGTMHMIPPMTTAPEFTLSSAFPYLMLWNTTHEDTDGGRESALIWKGEQSGGEISILAKIQGSHDGTGDTEKGELIFFVNDSNDGDSPSEILRMNHTGTDGKIESAEGKLIITTNEGTNTAMDLQLAGKGTGSGKLTFFTSGYPGLNRGGIQISNGKIDLYTVNTGPVQIQRNADYNVELFGLSTAGETATFRIMGYKTGDQIRALSISIDDAEDNQAIFEGVSSIHLDMGIIPSKVTGDPCGSLPEGSIFYNDTANSLCFCDGTNDLKVSDGSACF